MKEKSGTIPIVVVTLAALNGAGMPTTRADTINADLLAFIKG